jgi:dephospho-CoA kinase
MLTSIFSRLVITFGDRHLPAKTIVEEIIIGILLVLPFGAVLGHLTMRLASLPPRIIRADIWNTLMRLVVADMVMEILLPSIQCLPLLEEPGYSLHLLSQSWGFYCPPMVASALSPTATGLLFGLRLMLVCIGVHIGESFFPLALTGGIACGKSTVAHLLAHGGKQGDATDGAVYMVDTDTIAHDILLPNTKDSVYDDIVEVFRQEDILVEATETPSPIDRRKLGAVIFASPEKRRQLNSMTHPRIIYVMMKRLFYGTFLCNKDITCADVPLLYESGKLRYMFGLTIVVACEPELQLERLQKRNTDLTPQQCKDRIASQMSIDSKVKMANLVIRNNGSLEDLEQEVERVREEIMHRLYGVGLSLLQLLIIIGGSVPVAVLSKLYSMRFGTMEK